jgi:gamma-glutamyltranspeptidase/glutathione hydrolase
MWEGIAAGPVGGMATSPHHLATEAGLAILKAGGTAIEACVAMAACLSAVYPHMTGIGGDGFWLICEPDGQVRAVDGCGRSPATADRSLYAGLEQIPSRGPLAANTVAGTIGGWVRALDGTETRLPLAQLLEAAIAHAEEGVEVARGWAEVAAAKSAELRIQPGAYRNVFEPEGRPVRAGELLRQPALADSLRLLASDGLDGFYRGRLGGLIAQDLRLLGSPVELDDLIAYQATEMQPLSVRLGDARVFNTAPPTQGMASLLILALFDRLAAGEADSFDHVHGLVEATKQAFLIRDREIGDPDGMSFDPQQLLDDAPTLDEMAQALDPAKAMEWPHRPAWGDTCWFGAADRDGRVVSCIQSTYFEFGSGLVLPQTGITWQNRGSSFTLDAGRRAFGPSRKPFHTLNPALARFDDGRVMAYGTMGGEGQPQTQAAIFTRYARFGSSIGDAVSAPRWLLGRTWGEASTSLKLEEGFAPSLYDELRAAGHEVDVVAPMNSMMGHAGAIVRHPCGRLEGASDPRSDGRALGF